MKKFHIYGKVFVKGDATEFDMVAEVNALTEQELKDVKNKVRQSFEKSKGERPDFVIFVNITPLEG